MSTLTETIRTRRSVRTYDGQKLSEEDFKMISEIIAGLDNPLGANISFRIMDAAEKGLSSPVLTGEKTYIAAVTKKAELNEAAYGYVFEDLVLKLWTFGIGTVWIGGTMNRELFEKAAELGADEIMPCITPVGRPAAKYSLRETVMRKGIKADTRKPFTETFFTGDFDTPMTENDTGAMKDILDRTRWAPSAVNRQPWRIVRTGDVFHFYEKQYMPKVSEKTGDLQKIDVGIALRHFTAAAEDAGLSTSIVFSDPAIRAPENTIYVASVKINR